MKCLVSPLFLLLAMCFDMVSRETLFTIMYKNTKNVFVFFLFLICMIWSCFYGFLLITIAPNVCSIYVPDFSLICHRAVHVRWLYKWLGKPIKTFCYKTNPILTFVQIRLMRYRAADVKTGNNNDCFLSSW